MISDRITDKNFFNSSSCPSSFTFLNTLGYKADAPDVLFCTLDIYQRLNLTRNDVFRQLENAALKFNPSQKTTILLLVSNIFHIYRIYSL